jgi:hypothetical protein
VLAVDLAEVGDEKGILIACIAHFMVDSLHTLVKGLANQLLAVDGSMELVGTNKLGFLNHHMIVIVINILDELFKNSRCHHHIPSFA